MIVTYDSRARAAKAVAETAGQTQASLRRAMAVHCAVLAAAFGFFRFVNAPLPADVWRGGLFLLILMLALAVPGMVHRTLWFALADTLLMFASLGWMLVTAGFVLMFLVPVLTAPADSTVTETLTAVLVLALLLAPLARVQWRLADASLHLLRNAAPSRRQHRLPHSHEQSTPVAVSLLAGGPLMIAGLILLCINPADPRNGVGLIALGSTLALLLFVAVKTRTRQRQRF
jgi:hypothetical protein